jgi:hypothetical protein
MPDETISTAWSAQSNTLNLQQSGGSAEEGLLGDASAPSANGAIWESFDPSIGTPALVNVTSGTLYGVQFNVSDPLTTRGLQVYVGTAGTASLSGCDLINVATGNVALASAGTTLTGSQLNPFYWSGDTDSNAVGVVLNPGNYYASFWSVWSVQPTLLASATGALGTYVNVGTAVPTTLPAPAATPALRAAILKASLAAAPVSASTLVTSETATGALMLYFSLI